MGVIRAMRELGIPVDIVGGTSIGSMVGGIFAETPDITLEQRAKNWFRVIFRSFHHYRLVNFASRLCFKLKFILQ